MKLVKIEREGRTAQGVLEGDHVHLAGPWTLGPVDRAPFKLSSLPPDLIIGMLQAGETVRLSDVSLAVPLDPLNKLICAGVNYRDHAGEIKADEPKNPVIFIRTIDTLVPHGQPVIKPRVSDTFDFEGEIAIVIGKGGRHIPEDSAMTHVSGYTCFMDGSVREYQRHAVTSGKNFWRSGSMGPWVVTPDEVGDADMRLDTVLNGQTVQSSRASLMIFSIPKLINYCSKIVPLQPGDVIATGTPGGVGSRRTPPLWLKPGDNLIVRVSQVGELVNSVEAEA